MKMCNILPNTSAPSLVSVALVLGLLLLTACSSVSARKQERNAGYTALSPSDQTLVDQGKVEPGMDTNAVYIAWGPPGEVVVSPDTPPKTVWLYFGNRPVLVPGWTYLPTRYGYSSPEYTPAHYSRPYTKARVIFQNGRVVSSQRF